MKKVIAKDFDGTLFENKWPEIGMPIAPNINRAKNEKANGAVLILWTCREGEKLAEALAACKAVGLEFDYVNENADELKAEFGTDPRPRGGCRAGFVHAGIFCTDECTRI